jgi:hypothetical protein
MDKEMNYVGCGPYGDKPFVVTRDGIFARRVRDMLIGMGFRHVWFCGPRLFADVNEDK